MIRRLVHLQLLGARDDLVTTVESLQRLGCVEPVGSPGAVAPDSSGLVEPAQGSSDADLLGRVESLLALAAVECDDEAHDDGRRPAIPGASEVDTTGPVDLRVPSQVHVDLLELEVDTLRSTRAALEEERDRLRHYLEVLGELERLVPDLSELSDAELETLGLAMVALVLDDPSGSVVSLLEEQLTALLGEAYLLESTVAGTSRGCLLVIPSHRLSEVEGLAGADDISQVSIPDAYDHLSLHLTLARMRQRLTAVEGEVSLVDADLAALWTVWVPVLESVVRALRVRLERDGAVAAAEVTTRTFLLRCWVPADRRESLRSRLDADGLGGVVVVEAPSEEVPEPSPVELTGRQSWAPYRRLVGFLSWPSPGSLDPSGLMAVALPFLFGVMVGDIVYGAALVALGWWLRSRASRSRGEGGMLDDAGSVLVAGGIWAVVWGIAFGEALGSLGHMLGMPPLWFYRGGPDALEPLLAFAIALGWLHIVLGLSLGLRAALRRRDRHRQLEMAGALAVLLGVTGVGAGLALGAASWVVLLAAVPAVGGLVAASAAHGPLGALLGPLELIGTIGNVLSYLRVAAVGLASVYLAKVANELALQLPLVVGLAVAVLLHLLNLALAAFSPMVQALRLHYVEFFSKFHDGGGRLFRPLGAYGAPAPEPVEPVVDPTTGPPLRVPTLDATHER